VGIGGYLLKEVEDRGKNELPDFNAPAWKSMEWKEEEGKIRWENATPCGGRVLGSGVEMSAGQWANFQTS